MAAMNSCLMSYIKLKKNVLNIILLCVKNYNVIRHNKNYIIHPSHIIFAGITSAVLRNNKAIDKVSKKNLVIPL